MDSSIIDTDEIIAIVAKRHKILLSDDDPVLVTATLNEVVVSQVVNYHLERFAEDLETLYYRHEQEQKEMSKRIINASLKASRDTIEAASQKAVDSLVEHVGKERKTMINDVTRLASSINRAKNIVIVFGAVVVGLTAILAALAISL